MQRPTSGRARDEWKERTSLNLLWGGKMMTRNDVEGRSHTTIYNVEPLRSVSLNSESVLPFGVPRQTLVLIV